MDFQIASDLHLETCGGMGALPHRFPKRQAPVLILCGDVYPYSMPDYAKVLQKVAEPFDMVLYVPGNHEYYGSDRDIDSYIEKVCYSIGNVVYMNNRSINIMGVQFIGATMWTDNPTGRNASSVMNDYRMIGGMTPTRTKAIHDQHKRYVIKEIMRAKDAGRTGAVVMTHHAPDIRLAFDITSRPVETFPFYFSKDLRRITDDSFIKVWVHGHTHEAYRTHIHPKGPLFVSNAMGYPNEETGYCNCSVVRLY